VNHIRSRKGEERRRREKGKDGKEMGKWRGRKGVRGGEGVDL